MKHLHVVFTNWNYLDQHALSRLWLHYAGSPVVWIARIKPGDACAEASKYIMKSRLRAHRCVTYSQDWPKLPKPEPLELVGKWRTIPDSALITDVTRHGTLIICIAPACKCFGAVIPISIGERVWLSSSPVP